MDMTQFRIKQLDFEILQTVARTPEPLSRVVSDFLMYARHFSKNDIEGRIDFLVSRKLLQMETRGNKQTGIAYFLQLTDKVPDNHHAITELVTQIHRITKKA